MGIFLSFGIQRAAALGAGLGHKIGNAIRTALNLSEENLIVMAGFDIQSEQIRRGHERLQRIVHRVGKLGDLGQHRTIIGRRRRGPRLCLLKRTQA